MNQRESAKEALRPLTVRQILSASQAHPDAHFFLDDTVVKSITIVAHVVDTALDGSKRFRKFFLEDGSPGRLVAQHWLSNTKECEDEMPVNCYVRVIGTLNRFRDVNSVKVASMRRVVDMHEPFHHLLDAMFVSLCYERGPPVRQHADAEEDHPSPPPPSAQTQSEWSASWDFVQSQVPKPPSPEVDQDREDAASTENQSEDQDDFYSVPPESPSPSPSPEPAPLPQEPAGQHHWRDPYSDLSTLQRSIVLQIHNNTRPSEERGVSIDLIVRGLAHTSVTSEEIGQAMDELMEAGLIYTMDEWHYKVVD